MQKYTPLKAFLRLHPAPSVLPDTAFLLIIVIFKSVLIFFKKNQKNSKKSLHFSFWFAIIIKHSGAGADN